MVGVGKVVFSLNPIMILINAKLSIHEVLSNCSRNSYRMQYYCLTIQLPALPACGFLSVQEICQGNKKKCTGSVETRQDIDGCQADK